MTRTGDYFLLGEKSRSIVITQLLKFDQSERHHVNAYLSQMR